MTFFLVVGLTFGFPFTTRETVAIDTFASRATSMNHQLEENKDKLVNIIQWGQVIFELKDKWQERKQRKYVTQKEEL